MIQTFKCKETAKIFEVGFSRKFPENILEPAIIRLAMLNRSGNLNKLLTAYILSVYTIKGG
jgi:plasmid maintenance system killer protein